MAEVAGSASSVARPHDEGCPPFSYVEEVEVPLNFRCGRLEIIDLCTLFWYNQYRSDKQERLVIFVAAPIGRGRGSALAVNIEAP